MDNPRSSNDPDLKAALQAWDHAGPYRDTVILNAAAAMGWNVFRATAGATCGNMLSHVGSSRAGIRPLR